MNRMLWMVLYAWSAAAVIAPAVALGQEVGAVENAPREVLFERYYSLRIDGQRAGWMVERRVRDAAGLVETSSEVRMTLARLGTELETRMGMSFVERDEDGDLMGGVPVSMAFSYGDGASSRKTMYVWGADGITMIDRDVDSGREERREGLRIGGEARDGAMEVVWFTPLGVEAFSRARQRAIGAGEQGEVRYSSVSPDTGLNVVALRDLYTGATQEMRVLGKRVQSSEVLRETSAVPGLVTRAWVDGDGVVIRSETPLGGALMVAELVERAEALADFEAPEFMSSTFVVPEWEGGVVERAREVRRAVYVVEALDGVLEELPSSGGQVFERLDAGRGRVVVDIDSSIGGDVGGGYLDATGMADAEDEAVIAFARGVVERAGLTAGASTEMVAEALRVGVYRHITEKSLGAGFASASDVVRGREGDCTEHACLMVAAVRSQGISARAVTGLLYGDSFGVEAGGEGAFAYHMWVQVWVPSGDGGGWVDFDPSWPERFDAMHIALSTSDLADDAFVREAALASSFLGDLGIRIESIER